MICSKCKYEWDLLDSQSNFTNECPECSERIMPKYNNFSSISEGIYYCIKKSNEYNYDILKNKTKLLSYLDDILGTSYPKRNLIKIAIECDTGNILYEALNQNLDDKINAYNDAVDNMIRIYSTERETAKEIVGYFATALGFPLGSDFVFNNNISMQTFKKNSNIEQAKTDKNQQNSNSFSNKNTQKANKELNDIEKENHMLKIALNTERKKKKRFKSIIMIIIILVIGLLVFGIIVSNISFLFVNDIKNCVIHDNNKKFGTAFEKYFDKTSWDSFTDQDEIIDVVEFIGYDKKGREFTIQFIATYDDIENKDLFFDEYEDFYVYACWLNGTTLSNNDLEQLINCICNETFWEGPEDHETSIKDPYIKNTLF